MVIFEIFRAFYPWKTSNLVHESQIDQTMIIFKIAVTTDLKPIQDGATFLQDLGGRIWWAEKRQKLKKPF